MAKKIDIAIVKDTYSRMSNSDLASFLKSNISGLTIESMELLEREIISRNLDKQLLFLIENRRKYNSEIVLYCNLIRSLNCPICQQRNKPINAVEISETINIIIITQNKKGTIIGCSDCLKKANNNALFTTLFMGWWDIQGGIFRSIESISSFISSRKAIKNDEISVELRHFVIKNIHAIALNKDNPDNLYEICTLCNIEADIL